MIRLERTVYTDRPIARVWGYLSDFTTTTEWDPGTVCTTRVSGDGGPGTTYRNVSTFLGRETEVTYVVEDLVPLERITLRGENKTVLAHDTMAMRATPDGTEVAYIVEFDFKGASRYLQPLLRLPLKKLADDGRRGMREALGRL